MYKDEENKYLALQEYQNNLKVGDELRLPNHNYVATLSDINDNRTNNGEKIFDMLKQYYNNR